MTPAVLCPATMTPQPPGLSLATFQATTLWLFGPTSSATRKPPPVLSSDTFPVAWDQDEPFRSTPTSPLCFRRLWDTETLELSATRMASKPAFLTLNPLTRTFLVPRTPIPMLPGSFMEPIFSGFCPLASITAPGCPARVSGLLTTTWVLYTPRQTTTVPPALAAFTALLMLA